VDFFWAIEVPKKITNFQKNIEKTPYRRVAQKRYNFAPGAANHTFFWLTLYILIFYLYFQNHKLTLRVLII